MEVSEGYPGAMEPLIGCRLILNLRASLAQNLEEEDMESDAPWAVVVPPSTTLLK